MKIGGEVFPAFNPYEQATYEIHISGCSRNCNSCHNKNLQDFDYGEEIDIEKYIKKLKERQKFFSNISVMGGDLLCQNETEAILFSKALREAFPHTRLWLFTGEEEENIPLWVKTYYDIIKVGEWKIEKKLPEGSFPASSNQKILIRGIDY